MIHVMSLPQAIDAHSALVNGTDILMAANTILNRMAPVAPKAMNNVHGGVAQTQAFRRVAGVRKGGVRHHFAACVKPPAMRRYPRATSMLTAQSEHETRYRYMPANRPARVRTAFTRIAQRPVPVAFKRGVKPLSLPMQRMYQALMRQNELRTFEYNDTLDYLRDRMHATLIRDTLLKRFAENRMDLSDGRIDLPRLAHARARGLSVQRLVYY